MDLSQFSNEELLAIAQGGGADKPRTIADMSDDELYAIAGLQPLKHRESEPTREQKQGAYREMARGRRERLGPVGSVVDTIGRGLARGVPFMDDIAAAGDYYILGQGESYQDALDRQRAMNEVDDTDRPVASIGGQVGGALTLPAGAIAKAVTLPGKALAGLGVGAGYGAAYGAGAGDSIEDRADKALTGMVVGGLAGVAAPPILAGAGAIGRAVTRPFRGIANPEAEAARRIQDAARRDAAAGGAMTPEQLATAREEGMPLIAADVGGQTTRALARSAANTSPEARQALETAIADRSQSAAQRTGEAVEEMSETGLDKLAQREGLKAKARAENQPAYRKAYGDPKAAAVWDDEFGQLMQAPDVQEAAKKAIRKSSNRAVVEGGQPVKNPFTLDKRGNLVPRKGVAPTLEFWDHVHRNLADKASEAAHKGLRNEAADIRALERRVLAKLDELVPAFGEARAGAAANFGVQDAFELGLLAAKRKTMTDAEITAATRRMTPSERKLFREGFIDGFGEEISGIANNRSIAQAIYGSDRAQRRIQAVLGPKDGKRFEARMHIESIMKLSDRAITGNSTTVRQLMEMGLAGGAGGTAQGAITGDFNPFSTNFGAGAMAAIAMRYGRQKIDQRVARKVGEILASNDPAKIRQLAQLAAHSPKHMDVLRLMGQASARLSGMAGAERGGLGNQIGMRRAAADSELAPEQDQGGEPQGGGDFHRRMEEIRRRSQTLPRGTGPRGSSAPPLLGVRG